MLHPSAELTAAIWENFQKNTGQSPQEFLMNYRMVKAAELLKLTSLSIADIGSAIGYENQLHFFPCLQKYLRCFSQRMEKSTQIKVPSDIQGMMSEDTFFYTILT